VRGWGGHQCLECNIGGEEVKASFEVGCVVKASWSVVREGVDRLCFDRI